MKLKNKLEVEETLEVGVLPNAPTTNFSVVFETAGMFQRRQVGNIINKNDNDFLPSISNAFPTSVFAFNVSTTNANPNLTVSFVNQVAGTVFAAPTSLNGTPAFRMLQDSDLSQTSLGNKQNALTNGLHTTINGNKVDVAFDVNTYVKDKSNNDRLLFGNTTSTDVVIKGAVANGNFTVEDSAGGVLFRVNGANKVPYFPQLPAPQTGAGNNLAIFDSGNGLWKSNLTIGDLVTTSVLNTNFVPYTGATANVNLGIRSITSTGGFIGNATTATTLAIARTINGTSFNGSANIVTANWGTARNITIGNTTKSVNGSANVAWSLAEIGITNYVDLINNQNIEGAKRFTDLGLRYAGINSSTSSGWHRIAKVSGRGYFEVGIHFTGGSSTPSSYILKGFLSWIASSSQNDIQIDSLGISSYVQGARIVQDGDIYLEVYFPIAPSGNINQTISYLKGGTVSVELIPMIPVSTITGTLWAESLPGWDHQSTDFKLVRASNFKTTNYGTAKDWYSAYQATQNLNTNFITTNTTQTGLSGNKTTSGNWTANSYISSRLGYFGTYNSAQTQGIWSIGVGCNVSASTTTLGNQYGLAYSYISVGGSSWASKHQVHFVSNGSANASVNLTDGIFRATNGFEKVGQDNTQMLLAGGGHRPVSDFALVGSLAGYLPLAGGTMTGNVNWNNSFGLSYNNVQRTFFDVNRTIIGADTASGGIYLRPLGVTQVSNQVIIDNNGQINTSNHGNSSQWKQAYDWGNHAGLYPLLSGSYANPAWITSLDWSKITNKPTIPNAPNNGLLTISTSSDLTGGGTFSADQATASNVAIGLSAGTLASLALADSALQSGDNVSELVNDAGYITASSLPTVNNGALTLTTGTGLSGSANFTANQSGNSSFDVSVASTHKLPTVAEWNALPTTNTITRLRGTASGTFTSGDLTLLAGTGIGITQSGSNFTITNSEPNASHTGDVAGSTVLTIATNAVTNLKMAQMPTMTIKGNATLGTANPTDLTASQVLSILGVQAGANNYTHPNHTGDVTSVGDGATTIVNNAVTFPKMQNIATQTFLGRATAGTGNVEALTVAQMQTLLGFSTQTLSNSTSNLIVSNTVQRAALIGDVTAAQNSNSTTIANGVVTNAKMANMAANTFKGRLSTAGAPQDLTVAQVQAMLGVTTVNNGIFIVQGDGTDIIGSGSTSANSNTNTSVTLNLSQQIKDDISEGVQANAVIPSLIEGVEFHNVPNNSGGTFIITKKKTIINFSAGVIGGTIDVSDGLYVGYELAFNGCGEWGTVVKGNIQDKCMNSNKITLSGSNSALFWWDGNMWIQAI